MTERALRVHDLPCVVKALGRNATQRMRLIVFSFRFTENIGIIPHPHAALAICRNGLRRVLIGGMGRMEILRRFELVPLRGVSLPFMFAVRLGFRLIAPAGALLCIALASDAATAHASKQQETLWLENDRPTPQATLVLQAIQRAEAHGLRSGDYELPMPATEVSAVLRAEADASTLRRFDAALSESVSRFVSELHGGRIDPARAGFRLPPASARFDVAQALHDLARSNDVVATLESFEPALAPYQRLEKELANYRALATDPTLTQLPPLPARSIRPGDSYVGVPGLRRLLRAVGDLPDETDAEDTEMQVFDSTLAAAIERFQRRHGLANDGVIGRQTFAALTTPLSRRVLQIELSLERWRWLAAIERPEIVVNIPQFRLFALPRAGEGSTQTLEMPVIVGQTFTHTRTPVFVSSITQVIFQPYWDVPRGILLRELLPRIREDVSYLDRQHMEIVDGLGDNAPVVEPTADALEALAAGRLRLRQKPGPDNALGPIKFVMSNPYNIYLHATPEQALFDHTRRTFSHGCIRVSEPAALAEYVLRNARGEWNQPAIEAALCGTKTLRVTLEKPVSVVVFYSTAVAMRDAVLFFEDVYGHDRKLLKLLEERHTAAGSQR
jgi:murein L,D-transpeptidase YcbB/YkuD